MLSKKSEYFSFRTVKSIETNIKNKGFQKLMFTAQKMILSIKDFFSKCDQIRQKRRIWSHLLKKFFIENFILCAVVSFTKNNTPPISRTKTENV